jgi:hypothetical protein
MKNDKVIQAIGAIIGLLGFGIVATHHWLIAFGTFLMIWGNNIERRKRIYEFIDAKIIQHLIKHH